MAEVVSGFAQSLLWTSFFALCPLFFKMVANSGSNANSVANAELRALQYFWWFMVVTAFSGTLIANMVLFGFNDGKLGGELRTVLRSIARAIPSTTAATWLNWIIFRTTVSMPALYLLQINSFFWDFLRCHCCSRLSRGGGTYSLTLLVVNVQQLSQSRYFLCRPGPFSAVSLICRFRSCSHVHVGVGNFIALGRTGFLCLLLVVSTTFTAVLHLCVST